MTTNKYVLPVFHRAVFAKKIVSFTGKGMRTRQRSKADLIFRFTTMHSGRFQEANARNVLSPKEGNPQEG